MSNVAKLKKRAVEFEQKKQFDKALATYLQILDELEGKEDEADVAMFNRVGDLLLRQGNVGEAVDYYEKAVDLYAEGGFFNNAIALCNKILRNSPGRNSIYYKLGKISARKGFTNDAKQNFLEYADRMQKGGKLDEAFRALKEFADLCPDQDDIRLMLADQLVKKNRKPEAIHQLQTLYEKLDSEGRATEARATIDRMKAIDPDVEPRKSRTPAAPKSGDLVFLDVVYDEPAAKTKKKGPRKPAPQPSPPRAEPQPAEPTTASHAEPAVDAQEETAARSEESPSPAKYAAPERTDAAPFAGVSHGAGRADAPAAGTPVLDEPLAGLEQTALGGPEAADVSVPSLDFEPTSFGRVSGPIVEDSGMPSLESVLEAPPEQRFVTHDFSLPGELPMLDLPDDIFPREDQRLELIMPGDDTDTAGLRELSGRGTEVEPEPEIMSLDPSRAVQDDSNEWEIRLEDSAFLTVDETSTASDEYATAPASAAEPQSSPSALAAAVEALRDKVADDPGNWHLHQQLGEAMLEDGDREGGIDELEMAMVGFESSGDHSGARRVADEILHLDPNSVRHHQKRVEYSFLLKDKARLVDAYLTLADCLFRNGQEVKARSVYERVIDIAPNDARARAALDASSGFAQPSEARTDTPIFSIPALKAEPTPAVRPAPAARRAPAPDAKADTGAAPAPTPKRAPLRRPEPHSAPRAKPEAPAGGGSDSSFVNLSDWLREEETPRSTRMIADVEERTQQQVDFADMLSRFKQGVAQNVAEEDHEAHYDLGVAYKEMGLLDEAIAEFQKALRGPENRIRTYEALGQSFLEKRQYQIALTILSRALQEPDAMDEKLVGVLYLLGYASEALQRWSDAVTYYERVCSVDIQFRDVSQRLAAIERVAQ